MIKVEMLLAWEDGTWSTEIVEVEGPKHIDEHTMKAQALLHFGTVKYRKVVYFGLYGYTQENDDDAS